MKHNLSEHQMQTEMSHLYDSDDNESDGSLISYNSSLQNVSGSLAGFVILKIRLFSLRVLNN